MSALLLFLCNSLLIDYYGAIGANVEIFLVLFVIEITNVLHIHTFFINNLSC